MKLLDVAFKDLRRVFSNPLGLVMLLGAPLLITGMIYFAFGGLVGDSDGFNLQPAQVLIVNEDQGAFGFNAGEELTDFLLSEEVSGILQANTADREREARSLVDEGEAGVAVLIPESFTSDALKEGGEAIITLYQDPTLSLAPAIVGDVISQFTDRFAGAKIAVEVVNKQLSSRGVILTSNQAQALASAYIGGGQGLDHEHSEKDGGGILVLNPEGDQTSAEGGVDYIAPVMAGMMIFFVFFMGANRAESIIIEDEEGTLARLFTTPTGRTVILGGKMLAIVLTLILQTGTLILSSSLLFGITWGEPIPVLLASFSMILAGSGFGVLIMSFLENTRQTGPVLGGVLTVTGMIGGLFTTGIPNLPSIFEKVKLSMPQGWALEVWQMVLSRAALQSILPSLLVLLSFGIATFTLGALFFRRRFA